MEQIKFVQVTKSFKKSFSKRKALNALDLVIEEGEVFGFLGPNGAGKSTTIKILMDFIKADEGQILVKGIPSSEPAARRLIGYLPENPCFYDHLTAAELLNFVGITAGMGKKKIQQRTEQLLDDLKLSHVTHQAIRTYSKGMTQRIGLAMAMMHNPDILILDEPMSGLDPLGRRLVADIIQENKQSGKTIFFSSHILSDIERLCDRIGILHQGHLLFSGALNEFTFDEGDLEEAFVNLIQRENEVDNCNI